MSRTWDALRKSEWYADNPDRFMAGGESVAKLLTESVQMGPDAEIVVHKDPRGIMADRFRFLRAQLRSRANTDNLKTLLITSPLPQDGKSTVALNLATMLAEQGKRKVLLVEADLHHPSVTQRLGLDSRRMEGLADCLEAGTNPFALIRRIEPIEVHLLPAGKPCAHPTELLQSDLLTDVMKSLREQFDWVLIDSPPVRPLSDALLLRQRSDATLLVVRSGQTPTPAVEEAVDLLGKKNLAGIMLNCVTGLERAYSRYYRSYNSQEEGRA
jgi:capsular exopolysaccharide synthesis family protein